MERAIDIFIDDVREILAQDGPSEEGMGRLVERMQALVADPKILAAHKEFVSDVAIGQTTGLYADTGRRSQVLYTDDAGLTLVRSRFDPVEPTPIHSHSTWGVLGVYAGQDRHEAWRKCDAGTGPGHAVIELIDECVLASGDAVVIPHPPQDIHRQQGYGGEPAYEFVLSVPTPWSFLAWFSIPWLRQHERSFQDKGSAALPGCPLAA